MLLTLSIVLTDDLNLYVFFLFVSQLWMIHSLAEELIAVGWVILDQTVRR